MRTVAVLLTVPLLLAGCGSDGGTGATAASPAAAASAHNAADVSFAQQMIPHHAQAVTMSAMAPTHAASGEVKALAERIAAAQQPEIDRMSGWLRGWGEEVPDTSGEMSGHDMSGMTDGSSHDGMMTGAQLHELGAARGAAWDRMFLTAMIAHHEGAVAMAKTELAQGQDAQAKALAQQIIDAQNAEIAQMRRLLAG